MVSWLQLHEAGTETYVGIDVKNDRLRAYTQRGSRSYLATKPFSAAAMRYVRIREASGQTYWEYSSDGDRWTLLWKAPNPIAMSSVQLRVGAGTATATANPGTATFDDVNITTRPEVGGILLGDPGTWLSYNREAITHSYSWQRCSPSGAACTRIDGAAGVSYTLTSADVGMTLRFVTQVTTASGSATSTSAPAAVVRA
jgi:hypothetical protein